MNFMPAGFYDESTTGSRSSSSSSSFHHRPHLPPYGGPAPSPPGEDFPEDDIRSEAVVQREHMFDKVVTPSDVGKLNRLVIPKQHAEKYFPLDASSNEKGLLLNFEDRNGKPWRFRYSYWNSSQSYVMTKGWSRFVKEKKLDAGDIVSFQRGAAESSKDRLFIDWRRRPDAPPETLPFPHHFSSSFPHHHNRPWGPLFMQSHNYHPYGGAYNNNTTIVNGNPCPPGSIMYLQRGGAAVNVGGPGRGVLVPGPQTTQIQMGFMEQYPRSHDEVFESVPVVVQAGGNAAPKRLRLFGVNMDCPISSPHSSDDHILMASSTLPHIHHPSIAFNSSSSSSSSSSLARLRHSDDDKGKGSMSLDLDI
ncbi:hypothetical protein CASFOL_007470 [Castilleja foliolosa]|uniref:TF-B3 domain-containing protein n=1 Tax=Castilleja foliolosa TaxID=1961234 RepID=A0ABD3EBE9_9LAMI